MNLIQENTEKIAFYTSLKAVVGWLEINLADFDWHLANIDANWPTVEDPIWLSGDALFSKIEEQDYQFYWAVFSVFPKGSEPILCDEVFADGNPDFWCGKPQKQLKDSLFEIVCWDSSATLFIGLPDELGARLLNNAPGVQDLNDVNEKSFYNLKKT